MTDTTINPVFICGALRSGSTLFHLTLNSHPNITNPREFDFLFEKMSDDGLCPSITEYENYLFLNRTLNSKELTINPSFSYNEIFILLTQ